MFTSHISDKDLISKIYKELIKLNRKEANNSTKMSKRSEQTFSEDSNKYMEKMLKVNNHPGNENQNDSDMAHQKDKR